MTAFEGRIKELSKLINSWNLVIVTSKTQFDKFSHTLLNALDKGANSEKIKAIIERELCVTFGLYENEFDANILTEQIMLWQGK